jgi:hypothetical protein
MGSDPDAVDGFHHGSQIRIAVHARLTCNTSNLELHNFR